MAQFDIYPNSGPGARTTPFVVDVQSDLLDDLDTRIVIPLRRRDAFPVSVLPTRLTPLVEVQGIECLLETPKMAAVPARILQQPAGSLIDRRNELTGAIDFLVHGF